MVISTNARHSEKTCWFDPVPERSDGVLWIIEYTSLKMEDNMLPRMRSRPSRVEIYWKVARRRTVSHFRANSSSIEFPAQRNIHPSSLSGILHCYQGRQPLLAPPSGGAPVVVDRHCGKDDCALNHWNSRSSKIKTLDFYVIVAIINSELWTQIDEVCTITAFIWGSSVSWSRDMRNDQNRGRMQDVLLHFMWTL